MLVAVTAAETLVLKAEFNEAAKASFAAAAVVDVGITRKL